MLCGQSMVLCVNFPLSEPRGLVSVSWGGGQRVVWTPCPFPSCGCRGLWLSWHPGAVQALSRDMAELAAAGLAFARHFCL